MEGRFLRVNQAFADLIGFRLSEVLRLSYRQITPKEFEREEAVQLQKLSEQGAFWPIRSGFAASGRLSGTCFYLELASEVGRAGLHSVGC